MPYGYYQLIRFIGLIGFAVWTYYANEGGRKIEFIVFVGLAILFQPVIKIALGRTLWNIIDVVVGIVLLLSIFVPLQKKNMEEQIKTTLPNEVIDTAADMHTVKNLSLV